MKKILSILLLSPLLSMAQVDIKTVKLSDGIQDSVLGQSIVLKDHAVIFQKVYSSNLTKEDLTTKLKAFLPSVKNFQLTDSPNQNTNQFSGRLTNFIVNYRKFGGTAMGTPSLLNDPLNANVIIQVKDNKYRVIISEIVFKSVIAGVGATDQPFDDVISKNKRSKIRISENYLKISKYINEDFSTSFDITTNSKVSTDF